MKFPIVLASGYNAKDIEVEVLRPNDLPGRPECPSCFRGYSVPDYEVAAQQTLAAMRARCAGGFYDALRDAIYACERSRPGGRLP